MDRINIKCLIAGKETGLQLDKKAMPGEAGPCFMITEEGCFKGYITQERTGSFRPISMPHYTAEDLQIIERTLKRFLSDNKM